MEGDGGNSSLEHITGAGFECIQSSPYFSAVVEDVAFLLILLPAKPAVCLPVMMGSWNQKPR